MLVLPLAVGCAVQPKSYWVPETVTVERVDDYGWDGLLRDHVRDGAVDYVLRGGSPATLGGRYSFFLRTPHGIAGESISLNDLENKRIRSYDEPRIHFALVCASASCPKLRSEAYRADRLDAQLRIATEDFINDPTRNRFDAASRTAHVSKIFDWYEEDFTAAHGSLQAYLSRYVADPEVARGLAGGGWKLRFLAYDWSLNGATPPAAD
jgi:hypothetical protein